MGREPSFRVDVEEEDVEEEDVVLAVEAVEESHDADDDAGASSEDVELDRAIVLGLPLLLLDAPEVPVVDLAVLVVDTFFLL
mmetsp:Transcript_13919/g.29788  ORF Transcript_13919/g.29788 Transcript_13919/m.29788 type:complete len:82 (+) Transcript_13919:1118-1363(+)